MTRLAEMASVPVPDEPDEPDLDAMSRKAARRCHPDTGGSVELFQELQDVIRVLKATPEEGPPR